MANGEVSFTIKDYSGETSTHQVDTPEITAANFAAMVDAGGLIPDYYDALNGITIGNIAKERITAEVIEISSANAGSAWAQVESKWLVRYRDTVDGAAPVYRREIACPDATLLSPNSDLMNLAAGAGLAFVTAAEALWVSPAGNPIEILSVEFVGRNR
jgi:hypothetical protein